MNWDQLGGKWKQFEGRLKERWGNLTDDDLAVSNGKRERLIGKIQERYGLTIQAVEKQVQECLSSLRTEDTDQMAKGKAHHD